MIYSLPSRLKTDKQGYENLIDFHNSARELIWDTITLDFQHCKWFDANLIALLGCILSDIQEENEVDLINIAEPLEKVFKRNHFLSHFGHNNLQDGYDTTIKYRKFKISDEKIFRDYLEKELFTKPQLPGMSYLLRKKMNESILEIFNNSLLHGNCKHIYACGQYFRTEEVLNFTIVNLGTTIRENVTRYYKDRAVPEHCIHWAVQEGNTTKSGNIPGGLGLSLIRDFIALNNGMIQIVSSTEFWEQCNNNVAKNQFSKSFSETIVNLRFNLKDTNTYSLTYEDLNDE